jgi:hypothetical protein
MPQYKIGDRVAFTLKRFDNEERTGTVEHVFPKKLKVRVDIVNQYMDSTYFGLKSITPFAFVLCKDVKKL